MVDMMVELQLSLQKKLFQDNRSCKMIITLYLIWDTERKSTENNILK
jgi:hypothetical protein